MKIRKFSDKEKQKIIERRKSMGIKDQILHRGLDDLVCSGGYEKHLDRRPIRRLRKPEFRNEPGMATEEQKAITCGPKRGKRTRRERKKNR